MDIFNGVGGLYRCELVEAHQRRAKVRVDEAVPVPSPSGLAPSVAIGLLKGQAMDRAIQQATELGAKDIWLLQAQRSNVSLKDGRIEQKLEHWRRIIASACEQCGQLWMPTLQGPISVSQSLELVCDDLEGVVFDLDGKVLPATREPKPRLIFIGPEGGWSEREEAQAKEAGLSFLSLGSYILRLETATVSALAVARRLLLC